MGSRGNLEDQKQSFRAVDEEEEEEDDDEEEEEESESKRIRAAGGSNKIGSSSGTSPGGWAPPLARATPCQADNCTANMSEAKRYHRRHKVCELHAKAAVVLVAGARQRFCQQCSRFHDLSEFDEAKRSCRRRLAGHNERRRKSFYDVHGEGSN